MTIAKRGRGRPPSSQKLPPRKAPQRRGRAQSLAQSELEVGETVGMRDGTPDSEHDITYPTEAQMKKWPSRLSSERLRAKFPGRRDPNIQAGPEAQVAISELDGKVHENVTHSNGSTEYRSRGNCPDDDCDELLAGSVSIATRLPTLGSSGNDVALRRKLEDITKVCALLERKYQSLKEIGIMEANANFDKLKQQTEQRLNAGNQLITTLKQEVANQAILADEVHSLRLELDCKKSEVDKLEKRILDLHGSLALANTEPRNIQNKLNADSTSNISSARPAGSSLKAYSVAPRAIANSEVLQKAQCKENLYADLTGLIISNVKRDGSDTVFDCIQTGRNGTLHFKLAVANETSAARYEDVQFTYLPQLDCSRDEEIIDLLPDYLAEEITFPRTHAAKFYSRVTRSLTERLDIPS